MFKKRMIIAFLLMISFMITYPQAAFTFTIDDTGIGAYWGGSDPRGYGDVIQDSNPLHSFALDKMDITFDGSLVTVAVTGNYFSTGINYNNNYFSPGDLYINPTGWITTGTAPNYGNDTFNNNEGWSLVVTQTGVYHLDFNQIQFTQAPAGWYYRANQAWQGGATGDSLSEVDYSINSDGVSYTFNTAGLGLGDKFGLHWTMRCGNDVIEGLDPIPPVPEPASMTLLGLGLLGLGVVSRKKFKK